MTRELVHSLFKYEDGKLFWKVKVSDKTNIGQRAGNCSGKYETIRYKYKTYQSHRLIFLYFNGFLPRTVDHINMCFRDNRIENLREATYSENLRNTRKLKSGHSSYKGVTLDKRRNKWVSRIKLDDKRLYLGEFNSEIEAAKKYDEFALKYFGKFANINFKEN